MTLLFLYAFNTVRVFISTAMSVLLHRGGTWRLLPHSKSNTAEAFPKEGRD